MESQKAIRAVNVIPISRIKKEVIAEEGEVIVKCKVCTKSFSNETALLNHVKMEHFEIYLTGDKNKWFQESPRTPKTLKEDKERRRNLIKIKTEAILSSMEPTSLTSLASEDVSYIIMRPEDDADIEVRKRKSDTQGGKMDSKKVAVEKRKEKGVQMITGPFECLQPSNVVEDGVCHQMFFSCCEYSIHYRDDHTRRRKGLRCQVCEQPLTPGVVDSQLPYTCQVCNTGFHTAKELTEHMNTDHVKLKPFKCNICYKRFTQQAGVQQHMRMHTGDRPYVCSFCKKAFTQKSGLDQHLRIHTNVKPYRCVICGKSFCQSVHLKQHMRTHTNVSPFQCGLCQKKFKQSSHLNYHLKGHDPAHLSDEQKKKYIELMGFVAREFAQKGDGDLSGEPKSYDNLTVEVVEIEIPDEIPEVEEIEMQEVEEEQEKEEIQGGGEETNVW